MKIKANHLPRALFALILAAFMACLLCACSAQNESSAESEATSTEAEEGSNVLVAYFSATGTTEGVAEKIAEATEGDLYQIEPAEPYTSADLDYNDDSARCMVELNDPTSRPAISDEVENWDRYDVVFVGYPIWWSRTPPIMQTFVESYDWNGKTVIPFCTSGSSPIGSSATVLENATPGSTWLKGERFESDASLAEVQDWVDSLDLPER